MNKSRGLRILFILAIQVAGVGRISGQDLNYVSLNARYLPPRNFGPDDGFPSEVLSIQFDSLGRILLLDYSGNLRIYDGQKMIETVGFILPGATQSVYIGRNPGGGLFFHSSTKQTTADYKTTYPYISNLRTDSSNSVINAPGYFDWTYFITNGPPEKREYRRELARMAKAILPDFFPVSPTSFFIRRGKRSFIYTRDTLVEYRGEIFARADIAQLFGDIFISRKGVWFKVLTRAPWLKKIDIRPDVEIRPEIQQAMRGKNTDEPPFAGLSNEFIISDGRLLRITGLSGDSFNTEFVCFTSAINAQITAIQRDSLTDQIVLGTATRGIFVINRNKFNSPRLSEGFSNTRSRFVFFPLALRNDSIITTPWADFSGTGFYKRNIAYPTGPFCVFVSKNGSIWTSNNKGTIEQFDPHYKLIKTYHLPRNMLGLQFWEENGKVMALANRAIFDVRQDTLVEQNVSGGVPGALCHDIMRLDSQRYLIASTKGILEYNSTHQSMHLLSGSPPGFAMALARLEQGKFLFSIVDSACLFCIRNGRVFRIPLAAKFRRSLREIEGIVVDDNKKIWIATDDGLFVTTVAEINAYLDGKITLPYIYFYDKTDGLPSSEFNGGLNSACLLTRNRFLAFNSMAGTILFNEDSVRQHFPSRMPTLTFRANEEENLVINDSVYLKNYKQPVEIVAYAPAFDDARNLQLEYSFSDAPSDWKIAGDNRILVGSSSEKYASVNIRIKRQFGASSSAYFKRRILLVRFVPFFDRFWVKLVLVAVCVVLSVLLIAMLKRLQEKRRYIAFQNKKINRLDEDLKEKSEGLKTSIVKLIELTDLSTKTKAELDDSIKIREGLIAHIMHDLKAPLQFQSYLLKALMDEEKQAKDDTRKIIGELSMSNSNILKLTSNFLTFYKSQQAGYVPHAELISIDSLLDRIVNLFKDIAAFKGIELIFEDRSDRVVRTDGHMAEIILRNIVDNAIKYTQRGFVSIKTRTVNEGIAIMITDTGPGIELETISRTLDEDKDIALEQGISGMGYRFIRQFAAVLDARVRIESIPEVGTTVTVIVPDMLDPQGGQQLKEGILLESKG